MNSAGLADPDFWGRLTAAIGPRNTRRLDYVGLDAFPDVFRPIPSDSLAGAVTFLLGRFRAVTAECGVPRDTPVHVTETGWPTDERRTEETQAAVLAAVAGAVAASDAGVAALEWFGLRDGLSAGSWSVRFGLLRDDYTPKPAFAAVAAVIAGQAGRSGFQDRSGFRDRAGLAGGDRAGEDAEGAAQRAFRDDRPGDGVPPLLRDL